MTTLFKKTYRVSTRIIQLSYMDNTMSFQRYTLGDGTHFAIGSACIELTGLPTYTGNKIGSSSTFADNSFASEIGTSVNKRTSTSSTDNSHAKVNYITGASNADSNSDTNISTNTSGIKVSTSDIGADTSATVQSDAHTHVKVTSIYSGGAVTTTSTTATITGTAAVTITEANNNTETSTNTNHGNRTNLNNLNKAATINCNHFQNWRSNVQA